MIARRSVRELSRHGRPWRMLAMFAAALAVIAGMLVIANHGRRQADEARQAQAVMEQARSTAGRIDGLTWRSIAGMQGGPTDAVVADGMGADKQVTASPPQRRGPRGPRGRPAEVERRLGEAYGEGFAALLAARKDPAAGGELAKTRFSPAMSRFDAAIADLAQRQDGLARAAER